MLVPRSVAEVDQMIRDQVQENLHLDYKRSAAIRKNARDDLAKDVSAFANSDGGILIYGVEEKDHLPVKIDDGVDDSEFSREWIESAITTAITPRLDNVKILPLPVCQGRTLYVVEIAKTYRGPHQAADKRYYKRHNFKSEPMEDYEIADVRNRRNRLSPMISFEIGEYRRFVAAFDVGNISDLVAEDVQFEFPSNLPWPLEGKMPYLFASGMSRFPPRQRFRFLLCPFHEILSGAKGIPKEFSVRISYYHPVAASRVTDEWPVNFAAYEHSMAVRPEIEELAKDIVERFDKLNGHVESLNKTLEVFKTIPAATGLDLSIPTLRNLKRVLVDGGDPEAIQPVGCDWKVFKEILGVDLQMAYKISTAFESSSPVEHLRALSGMSEEILTKIRKAFILQPDLAVEERGPNCREVTENPSKA